MAKKKENDIADSANVTISGSRKKCTNWYINIEDTKYESSMKRAGFSRVSDMEKVKLYNLFK